MGSSHSFLWIRTNHYNVVDMHICYRCKWIPICIAWYEMASIGIYKIIFQMAVLEGLNQVFFNSSSEDLHLACLALLTLQEA